MAELNEQPRREVELTVQDYENEGASISEVPRLYRDQNPSCFDPQVICIGPLHKNVQEHEGLKATYKHDLLARLDSRPSEHILDACLSKVLGSIEQVKECYEGGVMKYELDDYELANMMVTDACFILEFLVKRWRNNCSIPPGNRFVMNHIVCDLVLLENQIPFFVLQGIFECAGVAKCVDGKPLIEVLLTVVLSTMNPFTATLARDNVHSGATGSHHYKHILDILHKAYQPRCYNPPARLSSVPVSHSAIELDLAGVNFKPNQDENWEMAIKYESCGFFCFHRPTLRMPVLTIHDKTELVLRNLIAYEQSTPINGYYFTSYACAMDMLVDNKEDVSKLVESKVIVNMLGSNESAANLINNIFYGLYYEEFYYEAEWKELDKYCNYYWPKHTARLRHKYFTNPWAMIGLLAGVLLFVLTAIQTIFTVKAA